MRTRVLLLAGAAVAVAAVVQMGPWGPWGRLRARYPGDGGPWVQYGNLTVELRTGAASAFVHRDSIGVDWGSSTVSLGARQVLGFLYRPLTVPATAIAACERRSMSGGTGIELWVADPGVAIGFPRYDESRVIDWCRSNGIDLRGL